MNHHGEQIFILVGIGAFVHRGSTDDVLLLQTSSDAVLQSRDLQLSRKTLYLLSRRLCSFVLERDLFVY